MFGFAACQGVPNSVSHTNSNRGGFDGDGPSSCSRGRNFFQVLYSCRAFFEFQSKRFSSVIVFRAEVSCAEIFGSQFDEDKRWYVSLSAVFNTSCEFF